MNIEEDKKQAEFTDEFKYGENTTYITNNKTTSIDDIKITDISIGPNNNSINEEKKSDKSVRSSDKSEKSSDKSGKSSDKSEKSTEVAFEENVDKIGRASCRERVASPV